VQGFVIDAGLKDRVNAGLLALLGLLAVVKVDPHIGAYQAPFGAFFALFYPAFNSILTPFRTPFPPGLTPF
jgi:hypothetical protein